jgi:Zn-dependent peptidase ImmA (M78 family)/antitoxin (DNA-binding transcriptional repressor) of toxin-antitoxin stability system/DNA-binding XRE family transcriptional regulator
MNIDLALVGERARSARERSGLTQRDVESAAEVSQSMIHRIESGKRTTASLEEFDRLAQAIGIGLEELLYGSAVEARVLASARASGSMDTAVRSAMRQGVELLMLDDRLDAAVAGLRQEPHRLPLEIPDSGSVQERAQFAAQSVRNALRLGDAPITDLAEIIETLTGADVGTAPLPEGVSGICVTDPERATSIILIDSTHVAERQRFSLAHELGHLLFGNSTHVDATATDRTPQEILCDEFARNLIIPPSGVRSWLAASQGAAAEQEIDERAMALLARHFGASPEATRIQLDRMGFLGGSLKDSSLPSGKRWAYRYGWGPQYDADQAAAMQPRVPRRILDRAMAAYREGKLGVAALAKLEGRTVSELEISLAEAGITVKRAIRRVDVAALVAQAPGMKAIEDGAAPVGMRTVTATEAARHFSDLLEAVEGGETVTIVRGRHPVAEIGPARRRTGADLRAALTGTLPPDDAFAKSIGEAISMVTTEVGHPKADT